MLVTSVVICLLCLCPVRLMPGLTVTDVPFQPYGHKDAYIDNSEVAPVAPFALLRFNFGERDNSEVPKGFIPVHGGVYGMPPLDELDHLSDWFQWDHGFRVWNFPYCYDSNIRQGLKDAANGRLASACVGNYWRTKLPPGYYVLNVHWGYPQLSKRYNWEIIGARTFYDWDGDDTYDSATGLRLQQTQRTLKLTGTGSSYIQYVELVPRNPFVSLGIPTTFQGSDMVFVITLPPLTTEEILSSVLHVSMSRTVSTALPLHVKHFPGTVIRNYKKFVAACVVEDTVTHLSASAVSGTYTLAQCASYCDDAIDCLAFEYGVTYPLSASNVVEDSLLWCDVYTFRRRRRSRTGIVYPQDNVSCGMV